jgi:hypothetical protein
MRDAIGLSLWIRESFFVAILSAKENHLRSLGLSDSFKQFMVFTASFDLALGVDVDGILRELAVQGLRFAGNHVMHRLVRFRVKVVKASDGCTCSGPQMQ